MMHVFQLKVDYINGATGIIATPELRWCDLENWVYYMGVRRYCVYAVDHKPYRDKMHNVNVNIGNDGKELIVIGGNFFLSDFSNIWDCHVLKNDKAQLRSFVLRR